MNIIKSPNLAQPCLEQGTTEVTEVIVSKNPHGNQVIVYSFISYTVMTAVWAPVFSEKGEMTIINLV